MKCMKYGIYNQAGELCKGELEGYGELTISLDINHVACYLKIEKEEITLGCRLIVEIIGGREDRLIFLAKFSKDGIKPDTITEFYKIARERIEKTEFKSGRYHYERFRVLGLWEKGDIEDIEGITNQKISESYIKQITGKLTFKKTSIVSCGLSYSISLLAKVAQELRSGGFKLVISKFPFDNTNLLIYLKDRSTDVDINEAYERVNEAYERVNEAYERVYDIYTRNREKFKSKSEMIEVIVKELKEEEKEKDIEVIYKDMDKEREREMEKIMFKNNVFREEAVSNAIKRILDKKDHKLLDALVKKDFDKEEDRRKFKESIEGAFHSLSPPDAFELLKIALRKT